MKTVSTRPNSFRHHVAWVSLSCALFVTPIFWQTVSASPQGGQVVRGEGTIQQTDGHSTVVNQNTHSMVVNWDSFNINTNERVQFVQPSASASVLNRIMDQNPSQIFGTVDANGRVFLINPNGIVFGATSSLNVGSLVASGLNIDADAFMKGDYRFSAGQGKEGGVVINRGVIQAAAGGSVNLVGSAVKNEGLIVAQVGQINLGAGRSVVMDFDGDGLMRFEVDGEVINNTAQLASAVSNSGQLNADGGEILLSAKTARNVFDQVINNEGVIKATRIHREGGVVRLLGDGGEVRHSGIVDASGYGAGEQGGNVEITGDQVRLADGSRIDVSGNNGGGKVQIGGGKHGQVGNKNASSTYIGKNSEITADSVDEGGGGEVYVWADKDTEFHGKITARGGANGGNGGTVEVSGKRTLYYAGFTDLTAPNGETGQLLLDPGQWNICDSVNDPSCADGTNIISDSTLSTQVQGANTILSTNDAGDTLNEDIVIDSGVTVSWTNANSLTLSAGRNITNSGGTFTAASGTLNLDVGQDNAGGVLDLTSGSISGVGTVNANGGTGSDTLLGADTTNTWNISGANNAGNLNGNVNFSGIENLTGGSGADTFVFGNGLAVTGTINGGSGGADSLDYSNYTSAVTVNLANNTATATGGINNIDAVDGGAASDTLIGANTANTWNITGSSNAGDINNAFNFTSMENLTGGSSADTFVFDNGLAVTGTVSGGTAGLDTLDYSNYTSSVTINLSNNTATATGGINNIDAVDGGAASDTLIGTNTANTWNITGSSNAGNINNAFNFTSMENLTGGSVTDTFNIAADISGSINGGLNDDIFNVNTTVNGVLNGGAGADTFALGDAVTVGGVDGGVDGDTLDFSAYNTSRNIVLNASDANGFSGSEASITGGFGNIDTIVGSAASDTLTGIDTTASWTIYSNGQYAVGSNILSYSAIESLTGGAGVDTFNITGDFAGAVNGGDNTDVFNLNTTMSGVLNGDAGNDTFNLGDDVTVGSMDGGADSDTLAAPDTTNNWNLNGISSGDVTTSVGAGTDVAQSFTDMEILSGGSAVDSFTVTGNFAGAANGGADGDIFTINATMSGTLNGQNGDDLFILGDDMTAGALDGGADNDTVIAPDERNTWNLTGTGSGTITTSVGTGSDIAQSFTTMENLTGGDGIDTVIVAGDFAGTMAGGSNADVFNINNSMTGALLGESGADTFTLGDDVSVGNLDGGADNDTLIAPDVSNTWSLTGSNNGTITTSVGSGSDTPQSFANMEILNGGAASDMFSIVANFTGTVNGGAEADVFHINASMNGFLNGDAGADSFYIGDGVTVGAVDGGTDSDTLNMSAYTTVRNVSVTASGTDGFNGSENSVAGGFNNIDSIIGGSATDTFNAMDSAADWILGSSSQYTESGNTLVLSAIETFNAGSAVDTFTVTGNFGGTVNAGAADDIFTINTGMSGILNGDAGADSFNIGDGASIGGINGGADNDILDFSAYNSARNIALISVGTEGFNGSEASVPNGFSGINTIVGSSASDSLTGINTAAAWTIGSTGQYIVGANTLTHSAIETINGGSATDTITIAGDFVGTVNGGAGDDVFLIGATMSGVLNGNAGADTFQLSDNVTAGLLDGGTDNDTVIAPDVVNSWNITGPNSGNVTTSVGSGGDVAQSFTNLETLNGGAAEDTFNVSGDFGGTINGSGANDLFTVNNSMSGSLNGDDGDDTFELNANVSGTIDGGADNDTFNLTSDVQSLDIVGGSGSDVAIINSDITVAGDTAINLGAGEIQGPGSLESPTGKFTLTAGTVTLNSVTTANDISVEALAGDINLGQLRSTDGTVSLTVRSGNIVNQNNGFIAADQLQVDLGNTGVMGSLSSPFELNIDFRSDFGNLTASQLQSRVFITDNSFTGVLTSGLLVGVNSVLAQANAGLSAVTKELNIIDPGIFLTEINLFNVEDTGMRLPADQVVE